MQYSILEDMENKWGIKAFFIGSLNNIGITAAILDPNENTPTSDNDWYSCKKNLLLKFINKDEKLIGIRNIENPIKLLNLEMDIRVVHSLIVKKNNAKNENKAPISFP